MSQLPNQNNIPPGSETQKKLPYIAFASLWLIGFIIGGTFGKLVAFLPNNASPLWAPAGLAFVLALLYSYRQLPLAWLGLFLVNIPFFYRTGGYLDIPFDFIGCTIISLGTTIQAAAGVWLTKRFSAPFQTGWNIRQYTQAFLLAGPLACIIGPTVGTTTLFFSGTIPLQNYFNTWILWWFGDTSGVLVASGLLLYIAHRFLGHASPFQELSLEEKISELPSKRPIRGYVISGAILLSMLCGTFFAWKLLVDYLGQGDQNRFIRLTSDGEGLIQNRLLSYQSILRGVKGYVEASEFITTQEWHEYIETLDLHRLYPGIFGIGYAANVPTKSTKPYVSFVRSKLHKEFTIKSFPAEQAPHTRNLFIVQHVEPTIVQKQTLGLDLGSDTTRRQAAEMARDTGNFAVSRQLNFYKRPERGFLLFMPVYEHSHSADRPHRHTVTSIQSRRYHFSGLVYASLVGKELFKDIFNSHDPEAVFAIYDGGISPENLIYDNIGNNRSFRGQRHLIRTILFSGQTWTIEWFSTKSFQNSPDNLQPTIILIGGLSLTLLLALLLVNLNTSRDRAVRFAQQASNELAIRNVQLQEELAERKKFEFELQKSKEQLNLALISTNDGLWDWNIVTGEAYFSPRWITMLGYEVDEVKPHFSSWAYLLHPDDEATVTPLLQAHLRGENVHYQAEIRMQTKSGEWKWIMTRGQVVERDESGKALRMVGTHTDISERKRMDESLKTSEERLKQAIACSAQGLWDWDVTTGAIYIDQSWFDLFGFDSKKASHKMRTWQNTVHHADIKNVIRGLNRHFKGTDPFCDVEYRQLNGKGQWVWVCSRGRVISWDENGKPTRMIGTTQDITSRKKMENTLIEAIARAEQANQYKSNFLANMSHEIRTPMNGILGMTEIALGTELSTNQRNYLEMVYSSAQSLLTVINDILDFSKIEAGKLSLEPIPFKLHTLVTETLYPMQDVARKKQLSLVGELTDDIPEIIIGDPTRLRQVLNNLLSNALKFTSQGEVKLGIRVDNLSGNTVTLHFWVSDSGIGLNEEQQKKIFEPFTQADNSTSRKYGGTGLGLSISTQLVEMMQGKLWVVSEESKGSIFHFTASFAIGKSLLPETHDSSDDNDDDDDTTQDRFSVRETDMQPVAITPPPAKPSKHEGQFVILLAEDNTINQAVAAHLLKEQGHLVSIAKNGQEAIQQWQTQPFDMILMDMHMPEMDGVEATQFIRKQEAKTGKHIPIIAVTASALKGDQEKCLEAGMDDYVSKPYRKEELITVIQRVSHQNGNSSEL